MTAPCPICDVAAGKVTPVGGAISREHGFLFHAALDPRPVAGWMTLAPERHVEGFDALTEGEAGTLGTLLARGVGAVKAITGAPKIYVACFAEVVPHLHLHLVPRGPDVPAADRGPRYLFDLAPRSDAETVARTARAIVERLR